MKQIIVRQRIGYWGIVFILGFLLGVVIVFDLGNQLLDGKKLSTNNWWLLGFMIFNITAAPITLFYPITQISRRKLYQRVLFIGKIETDWINIKRVKHFNICIGLEFIEPRNGRIATAVETNFYTNEHQIIKAIIEAASLANPNVEIDPTLLAIYGPPPYGIFDPKE